MHHVALLIALCSGSSGAQGAEEEKVQTDVDWSVDQIRSILSARDSGLLPATLPFQVLRVEEPRDVLVEDGWWAFQETGFAYGLRTVRAEKDPLYAWGAWDGVRFAELSAVGRDVRPGWEAASAPAAQVDDEPDAHLTVRAEPVSDTVRKAYYPLDFGLGVTPRFWGEILSESRRVEHLGESVIRGRTCQQLILDMSPKTADDAARPFPWRIWLDMEETFLAMRTESLIELPETSEPAPALGEVISWQGKRWAVLQQKDVTESVELTPGIWVPRDAVISHPSRPTWRSYRMVLDPEQSSIGQRNDHLFAVEAAPNTQGTDQIEDKKFFVNSLGVRVDGVRRHTEDFRKLVALASSADGPSEPARKAHSGSEDFSRSSCGPNALYLFATIRDRDASLGRILSMVPAEGLATGEVSMASLVEIATELRLGGTAVALPVEEFARYAGWSIVRLSDADTDKAHYSLAYSLGDAERTVDLFDAPAGHARLCSDDLSERWRGQAILFGDASVGRTSDRSKQLFGWSLLLLGGVAAFSFCRRLWITSQQYRHSWITRHTG